MVCAFARYADRLSATGACCSHSWNRLVPPQAAARLVGGRVCLGRIAHRQRPEMATMSPSGLATRAPSARRHRGRQPEPPRRCRYHGVDIRTQSRGKRLFLDFQVDSPYISRLFKGLDIQTFEVLPVACTVVIAGGLQGCSNSRRLYLRSPEWQQDQRSHGVT